MSKRPREECDTPESSSLSRLSRPTKRTHPASSPIRAIPKTPSSSTPYLSPLIRTPFSVPSDSPSNPFGLKRSLLALDLPPSTSFGKHTTLRMQLIADAGSHRQPGAQRRDREGVYRVMQVPLNYTFRHLHKLILYLFASDIQDAHGPRHGSKLESLSSRTRQPNLNLSHKGKARESAWGGHYFQVLKQITLYPDTKHPGVIKPGAKMWAKLSSVRERSLFRDLTNPQADATVDAPLPPAFEDEDLDNEDWTWEAEDDFTLAHVWPKGPTLDAGIIYHHAPAVRVHITANTLPVPERKGRGNTPFVFLAQGTAGPLVQVAHTIPDASPVEDTALPISVPVAKLVVDRWNRPDAFQRFLRREAERERALRVSHTPEVEADDDLDSQPLVPPSSDGVDLSGDELTLISDDASVYSTRSDSALMYMPAFPYPSTTPFPAHPLHRKRVERLRRRIEKLTRSGLRDVMSSDEEQVNSKRRGKGKEEAGSRSAPSRTKTKASGHGKGRARARTVVERMKRKTVDSADTGAGVDGWDPFGDEAELCI